jgi:hypothetical protein
VKPDETKEVQGLLRALAILAIGGWVGWVSHSIVDHGERLAVLWDNKPRVALHYPSLFATPGNAEPILAAPLLFPLPLKKESK